MNVYVLDAAGDEFRGILLADEHDMLEFSTQFDGTPMKNTWTGREQFEYVPRFLPKGDTPSFDSAIPVFNAKAVKALADLLEPAGELLPIKCDGETLFLFNVTRIVDALDEGNSKVDRFDDGRIWDIDYHAFFPEKVKSEVIFKIPQLPLGLVYATDPFIARVTSTGLQGFDFPLLWSSE